MTELPTLTELEQLLRCALIAARIAPHIAQAAALLLPHARRLIKRARRRRRRDML